MKLRSCLLLLLVLFGFVLTGGEGALAGEKAFGGVGLQVVPTVGGELVVLRVVEGSPAAAAGLKPGDFIFRVDDFPLGGSDFRKVVSEHLWGEIGSRVTLYYLRPGVEGERSVSLQRAAIDPAVGDTPGVRMLEPEK